jgi:hypothetical protein
LAPGGQVAGGRPLPFRPISPNTARPASKLLADRFALAQQSGELPDADPMIIARWINAVCQGISIQACSGATREELHAVADHARKAWPKH